VNATAAPWYFRYRFYLIGGAYFFGFFFGDMLMPASPATYAILGAASPAWFGARGMLGLIMLLTAFGALWRVWGASYLSAAVVHSQDVHTGAFHVGGPYRFTRNPLYFGSLFWALALGAYGTPLATALIFFGNLTIFELLIRTEERALLAEFGARFAEYRATVPRLIPLFFRAAPPERGFAPDWAQGVRSELFGLAFTASTVVAYVQQRPTVQLFGFFALLLVLAGLTRARTGRSNA
jgi:protein-S-isoprenylcysteine O-methyltransferase Ste14